MQGKRIGMYLAGIVLSVSVLVVGGSKVVQAEEDLVFDGFYEYNIAGKTETLYDISIPESSSDELILEGAPGSKPDDSEDTTAAGETASTFSVIGNDGRYQASDTTLRPNRWVAYIVAYWSDGNTTPGTAWMYGPSVAVTAGHCIYNKSLGEYPVKLAVYPAYNEGEKPYGSYRATRVSVPKRYKTTNDDRYDFGIIKISTAIGNETGYFSVRCTNKSYKGQSVYIAGYPKDKSSKPGLWKMKGTIAKSENSKLYYQIDTSDGQSGSPLHIIKCFFQ